MPEDSWVEPRARIPLAGIVAMVLIVAVVAVFLKTQLAGFFPDTTITVTSAGDQNVAGSASATFQGLREITLSREERLEGILQSGGIARTFTVDVSARLLAITRDGTTVDVTLEPGAEGTLTAVFTYEGSAARVDVDPLARVLLYQKPGVSAQPVNVPLAETVTYDGYFAYRNEKLLFQYSPNAQAVKITGRTTDTVPITQVDGALVGTWKRDGTDHPVTLELAKLRATIANVW